MTALEIALVVLAGFAAGTINIIVGSGTLISFPALLFLGYPPVTANISNSLGLCAAGITGVHGYRRELSGLGALVRLLVPWSLAGGVSGALLLLALPAYVFGIIVPILIGVALVLVVFGSRVQTMVTRWRDAGLERVPGPAVRIAAFGAGVYGGYFGAAQGVLLLAILGILLPIGLQHSNAVKNVLVNLVNLVAAITFIVIAPGEVDLSVALMLGAGALAGGAVGARIGRRLPSNALRLVIVVVGVAAIISLVR